jgi:lipopolysaccharide export system permease protein
MKILKRYLLQTYSETFFPIFLTLYLVTSIIFLVKISSLTSVIQVSFLELLLLYGYTVPTILFYILPVSILVSLSLSLSKLSSEYELIVFTSFGLNPLQVFRIILPQLILSTIILLIISFVLIPKAKQLNTEFTQNKKFEAQFNIKESEYGQKFGDWFIYVSSKENDIYKDIVLFKEEKSTFIVAKTANMLNENRYLTLNLYDGKVVEIDKKLNEVEFEKMQINNEITGTKLINTFSDIIDYWKTMDSDKSKRFNVVFFSLYSIFPIISIFFIISTGYFNPRYDKNYTVTITMICTVIYVVLIQKLTGAIGITALFTIPIFWFLAGYLLYRIRIRPYY